MVITNPGHATMRDWVDSIEALRSLDPQAKSTLRAGAQQIRAPKDTVLFRPGDRCKLFPIIVQGRGAGAANRRIRSPIGPVPDRSRLVLRSDYGVPDLGRTLHAEGICETPVLAYGLSPEYFHALMDCSAAFRSWVFQGYGQRIAQLMSKIEEIACKRIDVRLAAHLLALAG